MQKEAGRVEGRILKGIKKTQILLTVWWTQEARPHITGDSPCGCHQLAHRHTQHSASLTHPSIGQNLVCIVSSDESKLSQMVSEHVEKAS